ncbi:uncharacterized protein EAF01_010030 [Botrytis porri]|uniref:uncharacterized protein n=1 Tax=Botrytis porri TaxID=87229 RepID=UPI001901F4B9|nr:uncharacterized protein EAF01_010030 [Botrytis porri]KAF7894579.1 hypothetical protein EAF01_010030 [Botrytis porri]
MCNWICTIEVCPTCDSKQKTSYEAFHCESNCYPVRKNAFFCKNYRKLNNETIADSPCINCEEPISIFEDSGSSEVDQKTEMRNSTNTIGMSMKNKSIGETSETVAVDDVSEDERDSDDGNMSDVSEVSALSDEDDEDHDTVMEGLTAGQIQYDDDDTFDVQRFFGDTDLDAEESPYWPRIDMLRRGYD